MKRLSFFEWVFYSKKYFLILYIIWLIFYSIVDTFNKWLLSHIQIIIK